MKLLRKLFTGCRHVNTTFPQTTNRKQGPTVACLECGRSFLYDWERMKIGKEIPQEVLKTA
jgi:hypothetical protein